MENTNLYENSGCSNSSYNNSFVKNINGSEISQDTCISNVESQISDKNPNDLKEVDKIADHHDNSNSDPILRNVNSNEVINLSYPNPDNSSCHHLHISENRNDKSPNVSDENHGKSENKDSESLLDENLLHCKQFKNNLSPRKKLSKALLMKRNMANANFKTKMNSPTKRQKKQTNYNLRKKLEINYNCDNNKNLVQTKNGKRQEFEKYANDSNGDMCLNDVSTALNLRDLETLEEETIPPSTNIALNQSDTQDFSLFQKQNTAISPSTNIAMNHSDTQDFSQFQKHNAFHEESKILTHELNRKQSASHTFPSDAEELPLPNEQCQNDVLTCPIETVIDEFIESELSQVHDSCNNFISPRLSNNVTETPVGSVHSVSENAYNNFQTRSDLIPSNCFSYKSNFSTPQQNNNQSNILSVSSSSTTENRSIEKDVACSLLNPGVNENSQRNALSINSGHSKEDTNVINANLNSGNSTFVIDCNIINDFDSRNSARAGSAVGGDTTTIKVVLNLINAKKENSSNPNSCGNSFLNSGIVPNFSQGLHSSAASGQVMNNTNFSFPIHRSNNCFSEPPFFSRTVNELDTPPDSESHLIPSFPRVKNTVSPYFNDKTNFISSNPNGRSSTPKILSRKRRRNAYSHSSESANELQFDLNSSFSTIPSLQRLRCEDVMDTLNVQRRGSNNSVKGNQNKESVSETVENSTSTGEKTALYNPRHLAHYRNSRPNIYSDESENELSVSTLSLLTNEETDQSFIKTTDNDISPKSPLHKEKYSSKNKRKSCHEEKQEINTSTDHSVIKSTDDKIPPKTPLPRKKTNSTKIHTKKLFREEKWALDAPTVGIRKATVLVQPTIQKKKRQTKVRKTAKKPKTTIKPDYNLRLRSLITAPRKLDLYYT